MSTLRSKTSAGVVRAFDAVEAALSGMRARRAFSTFLIAVFLTLLVAVELHPGGWLEGLVPEPWIARLPHTHLHVIEVAFNLLLVYEVVEMVLGLGRSMSRHVGRQFVLFALILLRRAFEELAALPEPDLFAGESLEPVLHVLASAFGGLVVFAVIGGYHRLIQRRRIFETTSQKDRFVAVKKAIALGLLAVFGALIVDALTQTLVYHQPAHLFESLFTALVFGDVALVLVTLRFSTSNSVLFRNTGFAVCGVLLRLALSAPSPWDAALGVGASVFALGLVAAYSRAAPEIEAVAEEEPAPG